MKMFQKVFMKVFLNKIKNFPQLIKIFLTKMIRLWLLIHLINNVFNHMSKIKIKNHHKIILSTYSV
jgi:hypothetical protein